MGHIVQPDGTITVGTETSLYEAAKRHLEAIRLYQDALEGYQNGSASISETIAMGDECAKCYSEMWNLIHGPKPEPVQTYQVHLPKFVRLSNDTRVKQIMRGESFMVTALEIHEIDGVKYIVTEIGRIEIKP